MNPDSGPPAYVLDLFAVPGPGQPIPGGQGRSVLAGDLVLSPGRDPSVMSWLSPVLAQLAVTMRERPDHSARDLRLAIPVPARNGDWVVDGWSASTFEAGARICDDLDVLVAAGRILHARFASIITDRPAALGGRRDRWSTAERAAFEESLADNRPTPRAAVRRLVERLRTLRDPTIDLGPSQLVHADLAGNLLIDSRGAPLVIDVAPAWRPARWAEAVCILDAVLWAGAPPTAITRWTGPIERQLMLRAAIFRLLSDRPTDDFAHAAAYERVLAPVLG